MRFLPGRIVFAIFLQRAREGVARHEKILEDGRKSEGRTSPQSDYLFVIFAHEARPKASSPCKGEVGWGSGRVSRITSRNIANFRAHPSITEPDPLLPPPFRGR